jgi:exosortase
VQHVFKDPHSGHMRSGEVPGHGLPHLAPLGVVLVVTLALYAPVIAHMAREWAEFPSLSHGFAIPVIAGYLLWQRRKPIASEQRAPEARGFVLLVPAVMLLVVGTLGGESFLARISLPLALLGVVLALAGTRLALRTAPGIAYLFLMVPLPYVTLTALTYQVQLFDAAITTAVLRSLGVPVLREGVMLHLPNITLEVAEVCSSVQGIVALLALGVAYGQVGVRDTWAQAFLAVSTIPLGLASNAFRITLTALAAFLLGPVALHNVIHRFSGTTVFLLTLFLLIGLDSLLARLSRGASPRE